MWASSFREVDVPCMYYSCIWGPQNMFAEGQEPGLPDWGSRKLLSQKLGLALRGAGPFTPATMDITESCRLGRSGAGVSCRMVHNVWEQVSLQSSQFVLNKYPRLFFWIALCYFWVVETGWGKSPTRQKKHGKMFLQCVALIHLNDLMTSRGLQRNTMHARGSKEHPLPVLWNSKWIPGREHNARLL